MTPRTVPCRPTTPSCDLSIHFSHMPNTRIYIHSFKDLTARSTFRLPFWWHLLVIKLYLDLVVCLGLVVWLFACPVPSLVVAPDSFSSFALLVDKPALALSFSLHPLSLKNATIWPAVLPVTMLLIMVVITLVTTAILPCMHSSSMHLIEPPFAPILTAITPDVLSKAMDVILEPFTRVVAPVGPHVDSLPVFLTQTVLALVFAAVGPCFHPLSAL